MKYLPIALFSFLIVATPAQAANLPLFNPDFTIVPEACHSCPCSFAGTLQLVQNVMNVMIAFGVLIIILVIVTAGFQFLMSASNPHGRENAKSTFVKAIIGFLVVISAWLVVDFIMKTLYNDEGVFGPWNEIIMSDDPEMCIESHEATPILDGSIIGVITGRDGPGNNNTGGITGTSGCPSCVSLSERELSCKSASSCTADPRVADRLVALKSNFSGTWTVTEAYPPTVTHSNRCHQQGTCVDVGFRGETGYTGANVRAFAEAASSAGFRAVFETTDCDLKSQVRRVGVEAYCRSDSGYGHITGNHFSLYAR